MTRTLNKLSVTERQALVNSVRGLCYQIARQYAHRLRIKDKSKIFDFESEAFLAACRAAETYQDDGGAKFTTYASRTIIWFMKHIRLKQIPLGFRVPTPGTARRLVPRIFTSSHLEAKPGRDWYGEKLRGEPELNIEWSDFNKRLHVLTDRQRTVIEAIYRDGCNGATIGRALGITRERVRQLHDRAIIKLRNRESDIEPPIGTERKYPQ